MKEKKLAVYKVKQDEFKAKAAEVVVERNELRARLQIIEMGLRN